MKTKLFCLFFLLVVKSYAQQEPHFTMYWNNYSSYNPAASGIFNTHYAALNGRLNWLGIAGSPKDLSMVYDLKLAKINSGIGINFLRENFDKFGTNKLNFNYAYHFKLAEERIISAGAAVSYINKAGQYYLASPDPLIPTSSFSENFVDFNLGAMYKSKRMLVGISTTQLTESSDTYLHNTRHYFLNFSYEIPLNDNLSVKPGFLIKKAIVYYDGTFNILVYYKKKYWAGLNFNIDFSTNKKLKSNFPDFIGPMIGVELAKKIRIGYAFDYHFDVHYKPNNTSHEIVLALMVK